MKNSSSKSTILMIVALLVFCGGSFFGVSLLNGKNSRQPVVTQAPTVLTQIATESQTFETTTLPTEKLELDVAKPTKKKETTTKKKKESTTKEITTFAATTTTSQSTAATTTTVVDANNVDIETSEQAQAFLSNLPDMGILGFKYNEDGHFFYTAKDPWQRNFGFNQLYDMGAPFVVMYYDTMRCKFRYNDMDYMMQFWKGQYGLVFIGAEIGTYYKPIDRQANHYDAVSDEDSLKMQLSFYRKGELKGTTNYRENWWCTLFVPGTLDRFSDRSELELRSRITMKDKTMLNAFEKSLKENGLVKNEDYTISGLDVFVTY